MNYLARKELGKAVKVYECDAQIMQKPFYPRLGDANPGSTSNLSEPGYMAIASTRESAIMNASIGFSELMKQF